MDLKIKNKVALVTAASKGIGRAVAMGLAAEGCKVAVCARDKEEMKTLTAEIKSKYNTDALWLICDLENLNDIENAYKVVVDNFDSIDILVNNCGGPPPGNVLEVSEAKWKTGFEHTLLSAVRFCNLVIPNMILKEWGRIINITSVSVKQPIQNLTLSNTFRTGLIAYAKTLSTEVAKYNITVNNIAPGFTLTSRLYELAVIRAKNEGKSHEDVLSEMAKEVAMNRLGSPEEIASVAVFLASHNAAYLTGNTIHVDGGLIKSTF